MIVGDLFLIFNDRKTMIDVMRFVLTIAVMSMSAMLGFSQSCVFQHDTDNNGSVGQSDLLSLLAEYGQICGDDQECANVSYQGYEYSTVLIGGQCWFAENLRVQAYSNGDSIPANLGEDWGSTIEGATCWYGDGDAGCLDFLPESPHCTSQLSLVEFGRLYNRFAAVDERGLCPSGWRVPTASDFSQLKDYVLNQYPTSQQAALALHSVDGWSGSGNGTNQTGFNAKPGGRRNGNDVYVHEGGYFYATSGSTSNPVVFQLTFSNNITIAWGGSPNNGLSIRCIQDTE